MGGRLSLDFMFAPRGARLQGQRDGRHPFRLLLVGDFSGRAARRAAGGPAQPLQRPVLADAGAIDALIATVAPALALAVPGAPEETASFRSLDDLHPDALFARLALFARAREIREAITAPAPGDDAFAAAEAWLREKAAATTAPDGGAGVGGRAAPSGTPGGESVSSTLDRLLGGRRTGRGGAAVSARTPEAGVAGAVESIVDSIVGPHLTRDVGERRKLALDAIDAVIAADMRAILSTPWLRALEGAWRGAVRVVQAIDTDEDLHIALLDACRQDLAEAIAAPGGDLEQSPLHRLLAGDDRRWSLIAADVAFDLALPDLQLLAALGAIASRAGAPLLADAAPSLLGCRSLADVAEPEAWGELHGGAAAEAAPFWQALRGSAIARFIGLALPRVLARLPYGRKTDPISAFAFEELPPRAGAAPEHRVWGSAAFGLAQLLGAAFREQGWEMDPDSRLDLAELPAHTFDDNGEMALVPCTEVGLGERAGTAILPFGLMPLLARCDRGSARLVRTSSIAEPPRPLAGAWGARED